MIYGLGVHASEIHIPLTLDLFMFHSADMLSSGSDPGGSFSSAVTAKGENVKKHLTLIINIEICRGGNYIFQDI